MAGISSRQGTFAIGVQSGKGTPATDPTIKLFMNGTPSIAPVKSRAQLAETDNNRAPGSSYTTGMLVQGDVPVYFRPDAASFLLYALLGSNADSGSTPNYTHTITPAGDAPWLTCWYSRGQAGTVEKYTDCKLNSLGLSAAAGSPWGATLNIVGLTADWLGSSDTVLAALTSSPFLFPEIAGLVNIGGSARRVDSINWSISNNMSPYQADDFTYFDVDPGGLSCDFTFGVRFTGPTAFPDYKTWLYGGGTTLTSAVPSVAVDFTMRRNANLETKIAMPVVTYNDGLVPHADPGGDPIRNDVSCFVERNPGGAFVTATVKDQKATPTT